jgi:excisionase family DNA binding protein
VYTPTTADASGFHEKAAMTTTELVADGAVGLDEAMKLSGLQRSKLYELMGEGELPFVKLGARRLIPRRAITALLAKNVIGLSALQAPQPVAEGAGSSRQTRKRSTSGQ